MLGFHMIATIAEKKKVQRSHVLSRTQTKEDEFLSLTLFALRDFSEVFVFKRVRLHLTELANWNNRPEVSKNAKSFFK